MGTEETVTEHRELLCSCPVARCARELYEESAHGMRKFTVAAWRRWDQLELEARVMWAGGMRCEKGVDPLSSRRF